MVEQKYRLLKDDLVAASNSKDKFRLYLKNGFQMVGTPTGEYDNESFRFVSEGKEKLVMFDAVSTVEEA